MDKRRITGGGEVGGSKLTDSSCSKELNWARRGSVENREDREVREESP